MRSTLGRLLLVPAVAAVALLASQSANAEIVSVPFSFDAVGKTLPAGTYTVESNLNGTLLTLRPTGSGKAVLFTLEPGDPNPTDTKVVLRFRTSGNEHVLDYIVYRGRVTAHLGGAGSKARYADREQTQQSPAGQ